MKIIPSRNDCIKIVNDCDDFYCKYGTIENNNTIYKYEIYNYNLYSYSNFKSYNAFELRGLTFIFDEKTNDWIRYLSLHKFFNMNENEDDMPEKLKKLKLISVSEKIDGSMITFIKLPNGHIIPKTKLCFDNKECIMATEIYNKDINLRNFIIEQLDNNNTPIFELTSPSNKIVIEYSETNLTLLQIRDINGDYIELTSEKCLEIEKKYGIKCAKKYNTTLEKLSDEKYINNLEKRLFEGCVLHFENNKFIKLKTKLYLQLHMILTSTIRENMLIEFILNEKIDDLLPYINKSDKKEYVENIIDIVTKKFREIKNRIILLRKLYFEEYNNIKEFAIKYAKEPLFKYMITSIKTNKLEDNEKILAQEITKKFVLNNTKKLNHAKLFLDL